MDIVSRERCGRTVSLFNRTHKGNDLKVVSRILYFLLGVAGIERIIGINSLFLQVNLILLNVDVF